METLAIIPARGGSKGIPRKNVLPLGGKPLIAHNIEAALGARHVNRLVVSTDDPEIASISADYGAEVVWRPSELSTDSASSESALLHTLEYLKKHEDYQPDMLVFLQCTSPLTSPEDIDASVDAMLRTNADTALAVVPFHYFIWKSSPEGYALGVNHNPSIRPLRQERDPQYLEAGAVYAMRVPGFLAARHRFFGKTAMYEMPVDRRLEIDEPVDFKIAEMLLRLRMEAGKIERLPHPVGALILDFDGVFTDNKVYLDQDGREAVMCDRSDGWGLSQLKSLGIPMLILSTETNPVVQRRADKLGIACIHGVGKKWEVLSSWLAERKIDPKQVVYVGNDLNDLECLHAVGCGVAVADAHPDIITEAAILLERPGGHGAIRELCDMILTRTGASS
jgi:N-acylneuraminate cytidylyltransferase